MSDERPNPDELLVAVQQEEAKSGRGKFKIFFGYAAGVGKTYAMLAAARREKAAGVDVVVGYVEPHGRKETEALLEGFEQIPNLSISYRDITLREFDLDAALARKPAILLVDELAHTNAPGSRHPKRWQDIEELLDAGIDVYTTLNVQHVESLNDVIAQVTGIVVRETLPDAVIERADDIELVDLTPEDLLERLEHGKVYISAQAERALRNFFQKSNLLALRELSLRALAQRVQKDVDTARRLQTTARPWATSERLLVCVGPSPTTAKVIRSAKRMASALDAEWMAVAVNTGHAEHASSRIREATARHLALAESLGAQTQVLIGEKVSRTILEYAQARNVTQLVIGKTAQPRWKQLFFGTVVEDLLAESGDIDVYIIRGEEETPALNVPRRPRVLIAWPLYAKTAFVVGVATILNWQLQLLRLDAANIVMVYLLGVAITAAWFGRGPSIAASITSAILFDFLFVEPFYSFAMSDTQYVIMFGVMLAIGLMISTLTGRLRGQISDSQRRGRRTESLYRLSKQLSEASGVDFLISMAGCQLEEIFQGAAVIYLADNDGNPVLRYGDQGELASNTVNPLTARWVIGHAQVAGATTDTLPNATALFVPLAASQSVVGALGIRAERLLHDCDPDERRMLEACASQIALAIERDQLALQAYESKLDAESERLRSSLLSSVSHDLRTPLSVITGASSSLLDSWDSLPESTRQDLLQTVVEESSRLSRLVDNLLQMTRLETGAMEPRQEWHVVEELVGSALGRMGRQLSQHEVDVSIPAGLPLISVDGVLIEQLLVNLLENAVQYTPPGTRMELSAKQGAQGVSISLADNGPGLPSASEDRLFDKFFRGVAPNSDAHRGVGLGLAICKAIVAAHGGKIFARNRDTGGAEFTITLPMSATTPSIPTEEPPAQQA